MQSGKAAQEQKKPTSRKKIEFPSFVLQNRQSSIITIRSVRELLICLHPDGAIPTRQGAKKGRKRGEENVLLNQLKIKYVVAFVKCMCILTKIKSMWLDES